MQEIFSLGPVHYDDTFAKAWTRGTFQWFDRCKTCDDTRIDRVSPMIIEWVVDRWESGSDVIADFTWPGGLNDVVVTQRVRDSLEGTFTGITFANLEESQRNKCFKCGILLTVGPDHIVPFAVKA